MKRRSVFSVLFGALLAPIAALGQKQRLSSCYKGGNRKRLVDSREIKVRFSFYDDGSFMMNYDCGEGINENAWIDIDGKCELLGRRMGMFIPQKLAKHDPITANLRLCFERLGLLEKV